MYLNLHLHCGPTKSSQHHNALYQQQHEVVFHEQIPGQHKLLLQAKALSFHKCLGENTELITKRGVFWQYNSNNNNKAFSPNKLGQARAETHKISQPTHGSGTWIASFHAPLSMASSLVIFHVLLYFPTRPQLVLWSYSMSFTIPIKFLLVLLVVMYVQVGKLSTSFLLFWSSTAITNWPKGIQFARFAFC